MWCVCVVFRDRVMLCSQGWAGTGKSTSAVFALGLQVLMSSPWLVMFLFNTRCRIIKISIVYSSKNYAASILDSNNLIPKIYVFCFQQHGTPVGIETLQLNPLGEMLPIKDLSSRVQLFWTGNNKTASPFR